jgi:hypothetical protein
LNTDKLMIYMHIFNAFAVFLSLRFINIINKIAEIFEFTIKSSLFK